MTEPIEPDSDGPAGLPPALPQNLPADERYFTLFATALRKCLSYKPMFGTGQAAGLAVKEFQALYQADPFYHWIGLDSPLMYAAHKAAGGMTSVYSQIGIGSQWIFYQMLQDYLGLTPAQAAWSYSIEETPGKQRKLALDGRIELAHIADPSAYSRVQTWIHEVGQHLRLPDDTLKNIKGVVFEVRQGYKSRDSKRQNADIANASKAYAHLYIPTIVLLSTQIDSDVAQRYQDHLWLLLAGTRYGPTTQSTYSFCQSVIGYDLAGFFERSASRLRDEVEHVLRTILSP